MIRYLFGLISLALFLTACDAGVMPAEVSFDAGSIFLEPTVKWAIQAPASLFYSNGRPVSIQVGADRLEQLQWAEN